MPSLLCANGHMNITLQYFCIAIIISHVLKLFTFFTLVHISQFYHVYCIDYETQTRGETLTKIKLCVWGICRKVGSKSRGKRGQQVEHMLGIDVLVTSSQLTAVNEDEKGKPKMGVVDMDELDDDGDDEIFQVETEHV